MTGSTPSSRLSCLLFLLLFFTNTVTANESDLKCQLILKAMMREQSTDGHTTVMAGNVDSIRNLLQQISKVSAQSPTLKFYDVNKPGSGAKTAEELIHSLHSDSKSAIISLSTSETTLIPELAKVFSEVNDKEIALYRLAGSNPEIPKTLGETWQRQLSRTSSKKWIDRMKEYSSSLSKEKFTPFYMVLEFNNKASISAAFDAKAQIKNFGLLMDKTFKMPESGIHAKDENGEAYMRGAVPYSHKGRLFTPFPSEGEWTQGFFISTPRELETVANYLGYFTPDSVVRYKLIDGATHPAHVTHAFNPIEIPKLSSRKEVLKKFGYKHLQHSTSLTNMAGILKSGKLMIPSEIKHPYRPGYGYTPNVLCLSLTENDTPPDSRHAVEYRYFEGKPEAGEAVLVFDLDLFDTENLSIGVPGFGYGARTPGDYLTSQDELSLFNFLNHYPGDRLGEVLSSGIDATKIKEIWVHPVHRKYLLDLLKQAEITEVGGRKIEDIVIAPQK